VKITPLHKFNHNSDSNPEKLTEYFIDRLNERKVAFLEVTEGVDQYPPNDITKFKDPLNKKYKKRFTGTWISNFGYTKETGN